jgi:hypothetical protein
LKKKEKKKFILYFGTWTQDRIVIAGGSKAGFRNDSII